MTRAGEGFVRAACERTFVTSGGSSHQRLRRALATGNLHLVHTAALELPRVRLDDALAICLLMGHHDDDRYERAAVRWLARLSLETPAVGLEDLRRALVAFDALPLNPAGAREELAALFARLGLEGPLRMLERPWGWG